MYVKIIINGYIIAIAKNGIGVEITSEEYNNLLEVLRNKPTPESGFDYRLNTDLTWELYELLPVIEPEDATDADYIESLAELGVQ